MNTYSVEIHPYPKEYEIECYTEEEAKAIARARFISETSQSIYETIVDKHD